MILNIIIAIFILIVLPILFIIFVDWKLAKLLKIQKEVLDLISPTKTSTEDGEIDWEWIENYIKGLAHSKYLEN